MVPVSDADMTYNKTHRATAIRGPGRYTRCKKMAARRNINWGLSESEFWQIVSRSCTYCGFALPQVGSGIDRIDNNKGYVVNNCVPCCTECNKTKGTYFTYDEMLQIGNVIHIIKLDRGIIPGSDVRSPKIRQYAELINHIRMLHDKTVREVASLLSISAKTIKMARAMPDWMFERICTITYAEGGRYLTPPNLYDICQLVEERQQRQAFNILLGGA
jgi:hypothetical protein